MTDPRWKRFGQALLAACVVGMAILAASRAVAAGLVWPPITEPPTSRYVPGKWVWAELFSQDVKSAIRFYAAAFGWSFQNFPATRGQGYTLALSDGEPIGGMLQRDYTYRQESGSRWLGMISVTDVSAAARYAAGHGGKVVVPPRLLSGRGEVALMADPEGAAFGVIRSAVGDPPDYLAEDKQWVWIELWAKDPHAMAQFYSGLAGYEITPTQRPDGSVGYLLASEGYTRCSVIPSPAPALASAWLPYLRVGDVAAAATRAQQSGARVVVPPNRVIPGGRVALIADPTGAPLGLAELSEAADK